MEKLKIGKIVGTHALKGELKIRSFSDSNDQRFVVGHKLYLNEIVDPFIIKTVRVHKGNYLISFEGLQDINLVEKYVGYNVYGLKDLDCLKDLSQNKKIVFYIIFLDFYALHDNKQHDSKVRILRFLLT